jgi:hypothetical protein
MNFDFLDKDLGNHIVVDKYTISNPFMEYELGDTVRFEGYIKSKLNKVNSDILSEKEINKYIKSNKEGIIISTNFQFKMYVVQLKFSKFCYPHLLNKKNITPIKILLLEKDS